MLDAADQALALGHVGTGTESDRIALLAGLDRSVGIVCVAPGSDSVDERFVLAGNVCPVRRRDGYDDFGLVELVHDVTDNLCVRHNAGSRLVASPAAFAECERIIVYADAFGLITRGKLTAHYLNDLGCGAVSYRTAVND